VSASIDSLVQTD